MDANPFNWRGPEFLLFFVGFLAVLTILAAWLRGLADGSEAPPVAELPQDPFEIAYLRGGRLHLLQVAVLALIDRGLLKAAGQRLQTTDPEAKAKVRRPLEVAMLQRFQLQDQASEVFRDPLILAEADAVGEQLAERGLLPDKCQRFRRRCVFSIAALILCSVAATKILVALSRGRHNVGFLFVLAVLGVVVLYQATHPFRTASGGETFRGLKHVFRGLKARSQSLTLSSQTNELVLLAAVFGMSGLPAQAKALLKPLKLSPPAGSGECGSGCGSSSSCGGSSCGGGGGGCGGCGS